MRKNALLVISSGLVNGGVPTVTMKIVKTLRNEYCFDIIVGGSEKGMYDEEFQSYGGEIIRIQTVDYADSKIGIIKNGVYVYDAILEACQKRKYDVIHCENGFESGPAVKAAAKFNVPVRIVHSHGTYSTKGKNLVAKFYRLKCKSEVKKYSTCRLACSSKSGSSLFNNHFINVLNPLDVDIYQNVVKQKHDSINLLQIGYFCRLKNQIFSIKVVEKLKEHNKSVKLYLIGYDNGSGYHESMMSYIKENSLKENIVFLPSDYPKTEIMPIIDFLLLPSTSEGMPLVTLEAQASNVYAIVSNAVPADVDMGMCSFLPINYPQEWSNKIIELYGYRKCANPEKLSHIRTENFMKRIRDAYMGNKQ